MAQPLHLPLWVEGGRWGPVLPIQKSACGVATARVYVVHPFPKFKQYIVQACGRLVAWRQQLATLVLSEQATVCDRAVTLIIDANVDTCATGHVSNMRIGN